MRKSSKKNDKVAEVGWVLIIIISKAIVYRFSIDGNFFLLANAILAPPT